MANLMDGGSGNMFAGVGQAFNNISSGAKKAAKKSTKRKSSSTGSGARRAVNSQRNAVNNIGRSVARSSRSSNRRSNNYSSRSSNSRQTTPRYSSSGSGSGNGYRPSSGSTSSGVIAPVAPKPTPLTPEQWLAKDTTYTGQQNSYKKALADYLANYNAELGKYNNEYRAATDKVGVERGEGLTNLQDDYASRGLLNSGVFGEATQKYNTDMDTRLADMQRAKSAYESDLLSDKSNWTTNQQELLTKAKQEALNRRLANYGL
jgi:hypothetical protein